MAQTKHDIIIKAISDLNTKFDSKFDELKEEVLMNRDDMGFVKDVRKVFTVEQMKADKNTLDNLVSLKSRALGFIVGIQMIGSVVLWYIAKVFH